MSKRKISIEDFKNNRILSLHVRKSKEVARALDNQSETLPHSKVFNNTPIGFIYDPKGHLKYRPLLLRS